MANCTSGELETCLYTKEDLLSLYSQKLQNEKEEIIKVIRPASLVPFTAGGVITKEQDTEWSSMSKQESRRALLDFVLEQNSVERYIRFGQCVHYINKGKAERIFYFIPDLIAVGLHDSIRKRGNFDMYNR